MFCGAGVKELQDINEFQIEMIERLARVEEKLGRITDIIPLIEGHTEKIARMDESLKSAHKRISEIEDELSEDMRAIKAALECFEDRIYKRMGMLAGAMAFIFFLFDRLGGRI